MVKFSAFGAKGAAEDVSVAPAETPKFEKVNWKKEPHLRKLYLLSIGLMVAAATTGYDGYGMFSARGRSAG